MESAPFGPRADSAILPEFQTLDRPTLKVQQDAIGSSLQVHYGGSDDQGLPPRLAALMLQLAQTGERAGHDGQI